ncbi:MAG: hypothetical protein WC356_04235 [Candidatus Micrarchaeia archaeon]
MPTDESFWLNQIARLSQPDDFGAQGIADQRQGLLRQQVADEEKAMGEYNQPVRGWEKWQNPIIGGLTAIAAIHDLTSGNRSLRRGAPGKVAQVVQTMTVADKQRQAKRKEKLALALEQIAGRVKMADTNYDLGMDVAKMRQEGRKTALTGANYGLGGLMEGKRVQAENKRTDAAAQKIKPEEIEMARARNLFDNFYDKLIGSGQPLSYIYDRFNRIHPREYNYLVSAGEIPEMQDSGSVAQELYMNALEAARKQLPNGTAEQIQTAAEDNAKNTFEFISNFRNIGKF